MGGQLEGMKHNPGNSGCVVGHEEKNCCVCVCPLGSLFTKGSREKEGCIKRAKENNSETEGYCSQLKNC